MKDLSANKISENSNISIESYLNYFYEIIQNAVQKIDRIILDTEERFLGIGANLQKNYTITKDITGSASNAANILCSEKMLNNIEYLNQIMDNSVLYLSNSSRNIESGEKILREVLVVLNKAVDNVEGFNRIVKHLRMLGISTKIESARLNIQESGFAAIADNVEQLSTIIHNKADDIREKAYFLIKIILAAQSKIEKLENLQTEQSNLIINNTRFSFNSLLSRYNNYSEKTKIISDISEKVSSSISNIVASIQTHDITRQKLEHVKDALTDALGKIKIGLNGNKVNQNFNETEFHSILDICEMQSEQLRFTRDEFIQAVVDINGSLSTINESLSELSDNILQISGNGSSDESFITEIEKGLNQTSTELSKNFNINLELISSMKSVADTVGNLHAYVHEIDEIGTEVEMIALNARVKAAHTGSEGAALGVLAESIQRLSGDARAHTIQMSETLTQIMSFAENLKDNTGLESKDIKQEEIHDLYNRIELLLNSLKEINNSAVLTIIETKNSILNVKNSVKNVVCEFQIQETINYDISEVTDNLDELIITIKKFSSYKGSNKSSNLEQLKKNYTTGSERTIHEKLASIRNIIKTDIKSKAKDHKNSSELGENIELF